MPTTPSSFRITMKQVYAFSALAIALILGFTALTSSREVLGDKEAKQKAIKFSHQFHVKDAGVACADCHEKAATSKLSSDNLISQHENCQSCHEEQLKANCTFCHTSSDQTTYKASQLKRELVFSHEAHTKDQNIQCETCHKDMNPADGSISMPAMATCNTCHNDVKATNACETCHTDFSALRPKEHNRTDFVREHKRFARLSDATCASCHTQESCIDCHNGSDLQKVDVPGKDLVSSRGPRLTANSRGQGQKLTKVHDLNFRFTHGIAAAGKASDCQTCHNQQTFCGTCHAAGGDVNQIKFKPVTHSEAGFVIIGVGSGGGKHASLARRNMESCASCHDAQGADPTCTTCHMDPDGIKGNDPKSHARGFMAGIKGDWHSDPGSTCFTCHTDPSSRVGGIKGQGFCGYCHK